MFDSWIWSLANYKCIYDKYATISLKTGVCKWTFRNSEVVAWLKHPKGILSEELFSHFKLCFDPGGSHFTDTLGFRSVCQLPFRLERGLMGKRCALLVNLTWKKKERRTGFHAESRSIWPSLDSWHRHSAGHSIVVCTPWQMPMKMMTIEVVFYH